MAISAHDLQYLRRCVELARTALDDGDEPFGSVLVDETGRTVFEDRNRVAGGDATAHPEFAIARWAVHHLTPDQRRAATVYTSGEHCPMCAAAIGFARVRRLYYAAPDPKGGGVDHGPRVYAHPTCHHRPEVYGGIGEVEAAALLRGFFRERR